MASIPIESAESARWHTTSDRTRGSFRNDFADSVRSMKPGSTGVKSDPDDRKRSSALWGSACNCVDDRWLQGFSFARYGTGTPIYFLRCIGWLKGIAWVRLEGGRQFEAEVHWYEAAGIGRKEFKIKRILGERI